jgi:hypothetical protein
MYCPLQAAYQIPTFASKRRNGCSAPPPQAGAGARQQQQAMDPYDPQGIDEGLGGQTPTYQRYGVEDFVNPPVRSGNASGNANRDTTGSPPVDVVQGSYAAQTSDINYYSKYGLQFPNVEGFADTDGSKCVSPDTTYRVPISDKTKQGYDAAFQTALTQNQGSGNTSATTPYVAQVRKTDMSKVKGFYDEDLENYLQTTDMKAAPSASVPWSSTPIPAQVSDAAPAPLNKTPASPDSNSTQTPLSKALATFKGQLTPASTASSPSSYDKTSSASASANKDYILELLLFVLCGILVIFLCDQLYRLAVLTGMRDTVEFVRPYIINAAATATATATAAAAVSNPSA